MLAFYIVFGLLLDRGTEDFVVFLLCGLIPWLWFAKSVNNAASSILTARGLILQISLPKIFFPAVSVLQDTAKQLIVFTLLILFLLLYGIEMQIAWLAVIPIAIVELVLIMGCAFMAAAVTPFLPDFRFLVSTGIQLLMFASGVFYSIELIRPEHRDLFFLNPMASILNSYRTALLYGAWPDWSVLAWVFLGSIIVLLITVFMVLRFDGVYPRLVTE
jgi:lipopolysaccharide transport system permease protein